MKDEWRVFTIPNVLSFFRILLIPFIVWTYVSGNIVLSAVLIVLSGLTDIVDGFIARKFNMVSSLGKVLDPIADKLTLGAIIISVSMRKRNIFVLMVLFIVKEVLMGIEGLIILKKTGTTYSAKWYGKVTTLLLYVSMVIMILWVNMPLMVCYILTFVCSVAVILSFVLYTVLNCKKLRLVK